MEAADSKMFVPEHQTTWCHISEVRNHNVFFLRNVGL
jgi:hypothetical protein